MKLNLINRLMVRKTLFKDVCGMIIAMAFTACGSNSIEGEWVQPVPGMENTEQGICLEKGGKASSINMATLKYEAWVQQGNRLLLSGQSIGNGQTIIFTDTLIIEKLTNTELVLTNGDMTINYHKK